MGVVFVASYNSNFLFLGFYSLFDIGCGDATMIGQYVRWALVNLKELSLSLNLPALAIQDKGKFFILLLYRAFKSSSLELSMCRLYSLLVVHVNVVALIYALY